MVRMNESWKEYFTVRYYHCIEDDGDRVSKEERILERIFVV